MKCRYCGATINNDSRFCQYCGKTVILNEELENLMQPAKEEQVVEKEPEYKVVKEEHIEKREPKVKPQKTKTNKKHKRYSKQAIRSYIMVGLALIAIICICLLPLITPEKSKQIIDAMWTNDLWNVVNLCMFGIPSLFIILMGRMGWVLVLFIALIGIGISLLTMIRTTRTKKMILLGIIASYVVIAIIALIIFETKVK